MGKYSYPLEIIYILTRHVKPADILYPVCLNWFILYFFDEIIHVKSITTIKLSSKFSKYKKKY